MKLRMSTKIMIGFLILYVVFLIIENLPKPADSIKSFNFVLRYQRGRPGDINADAHVTVNEKITADDKMSVLIVVFSKVTPESEFEKIESKFELVKTRSILRYQLPPKFGNFEILKKIMVVLYRSDIEIDQKFVDFTKRAPGRSANKNGKFISREYFDQITY